MKTLSIDLRWIDASGVGVYIKGIMPGLLEQLSDVAIAAIGDPARLQSFPWSRAANLRIIDCRAGRYSIAEQIQLPRAIPRETDLFFSPYYSIPLAYRGKLAVTVHDMSHLLLPEITSDWKKRIYAKTMYRALRKRASVIFTVSQFSKDELLRLTSGPHQQNIIPTHLGISPEWFEASSLPRVHERPYFIYVGNIKPYKGVGRLVEAFLSIKDRLPHDLLIVGQSEGLITGESPEFFERVRSSQGRIQLVGQVPYERLRAFVAHAEALVLPSLYEGFGLPPVEAMAAGVPALVSNAASLPEVCGDAALYFDPLNLNEIAAQLLAVTSNPQLRADLIQRGTVHSRSLSWSACSTATADALRCYLEI